MIEAAVPAVVGMIIVTVAVRPLEDKSLTILYKG